jgi:hypothetical protein
LKVYSISKPAFWAISILILALPVSRHWNVLTRGERSTGQVGNFVITEHEHRLGNSHLEMASEIRFSTGDSVILTHGPPGYEMTYGKEVTIMYKKEDPSRHVMANFAGFYLYNYTALVIIILVFWAAFYMSFNYYRKKVKTGTKSPSKSPYAQKKGRDPRDRARKLKA